MDRTENKSDAPCFQVGDKVRVKLGVPDPEFPYITLGGWSGTIEEVEQARDQLTYLIEWDERTIASLPPLYVQAVSDSALCSRLFGWARKTSRLTECESH